MRSFNILFFSLLQEIFAAFANHLLIFISLKHFVNTCFLLLKGPYSFVNDEIFKSMTTSKVWKKQKTIFMRLHRRVSTPRRNLIFTFCTPKIVRYIALQNRPRFSAHRVHAACQSIQLADDRLLTAARPVHAYGKIMYTLLAVAAERRPCSSRSISPARRAHSSKPAAALG